MEAHMASKTTLTQWLARLGLAVAVAGLVLTVVSGWGYRHGWWGLRVALRYLFGYGGIAAAAGGVVSLAALVLAVALKSRGAVLAVLGVAAGVGPALAFYHQYRLARSVPPINDISTDLVNPPAYVTAAANEFWRGKDMRYPAGFADSVRRGYPDLHPLVLPLPSGRVYTLALETARRMPRWEITGTDSAAGRIEATATTKWFGFKDDVVLRIAPRGADSAVVDMRSKSRVGKSDVGANAARIRAYFSALAQAAAPAQ
jgi:uncharacterized protein (DUF1499 family)